MQVILLKDVRGLGRKSEVKEVKEGYARNLLFPQKAAVIATPQELARLAQKKADEKKMTAERQEAAHAFIKKLSSETLEFPLTVGSKGEIFSSITSKQIEEELTRRGYGAPRVLLPHPVKELGSFTAEIDFGNEIKTALLMRAVRETES